MEGTVGAGTNTAKRSREEQEEAPESKRIRAADLIFLDILDDVDPADRSADGDLATVMKSLEEEIASLSPPPALPEQQQQPAGGTSEMPAATSASDPEERRGSDLGYLLEASDDELGLPPTLPSSSDEGEGGAAEGDFGEDGGDGAGGFGQMWGLDEDIPNSYDSLDFGVIGLDGGVPGGDDSAAVAFDGGLFDYADVAFFVPPDFSDFSWQPESLPAV